MNIHFKGVLLVIAFILNSLLLLGCGHSPSTSSLASSHTPNTLFVGLDRSESTDNFRKQMLDQLDLTADIAANDKSVLKVWAFDRQPLQLYQGTPSSHDDLRDVKREELAPDVKHPRTITRPALLLEAWIKERQLHPAPNCRAVILSDGDSEVYTDQARLKTAVATLGKDPAFHLAVIGIKPEDRKMWDGVLATAMPGRYLLADEQNGQSDLAQFLHK